MAFPALDHDYQCLSPDLWNFELAQAESEESAKLRFESQPGVEYILRKNRIRTQRLSWLQAPEGSSKLLWPKRASNTVPLRC